MRRSCSSSTCCAWADGSCWLVRCGDLERATVVEGPVDEEDLHRDVRVDVRLAQERDDVTAGELFDLRAVAVGHHALELVTQRDNAIGPRVVHHRLLQRS